MRVTCQSGARLPPLSVDGLIVAASLVLLHEARQGRWAPVLARLMPALGVSANVASGVAFGVLGAIISAWPAVAFIGSAEMALSMIRSARCSFPDERTGQRTLVSFVPADALEAAGAASNPISQRQMIARFVLTRTQERKVRQSVPAECNGHDSGGSS